ncbi:hypothetical protein RhiJN_06189 [Ceratobasidium sp. AG-Ba]|nr:hypothetical protein RhiJN_06189 [Ceratobasidium sp. AG-Ba]QRW07131.1 hypothetical protein RhiLY_06130 [Ceratobasidium sp. AG-Ba]
MDFGALLNTVMNVNPEVPANPEHGEGLPPAGDDLPIDPALLLLPQPQSRRRRRTDFDDIDEPEEQYLSRLLEFTEVSLDQNGIQGETRNLIRSYSQLRLEEKLIELMSVIAKKEMQIPVDAAQMFISSSAYSNHVVNRLKVALLAPHLLSYVSALQEWVLSNIQQHPQVWQVPQCCDPHNGHIT